MKKNILITVIIACLFLLTPFMIDTGGSFQTRGTSMIHDSGNFTVTIDDDGGHSGWKTLEYPIGQDRLNKAYFGIGINSSTVDFGGREDLVSKDSLTISSPGNGTDEEGYCSFTGEGGQDFENYNITQRTFLNNYTEDARGHTGRWMVVDYMIETNEVLSEPLYLIQMMDIDLGDPSNDNFIWDATYNMAVAWEGTTFIGLSYFNYDTTALHGHNAGAMTSSVFDGEEAIFQHMESPNNQSTSGAMQNWYMDLVVKVNDTTFTGSARFGFVIVVGTSLNDLKNAVEDARYAMRGSWTHTPITGWQRGEVDVEAFYEGPVFPRERISLYYTLLNVDGTDFPPITYGPDNNILFSMDSTPDRHWYGQAFGHLNSMNPWGYWEHYHAIGFDYDNKGPEVSIIHNSPADGTLHIEVVPDDHDGSGAASISMMLDDGFDNITYCTSSIIDYTNEGSILLNVIVTDEVGNYAEFEVPQLINDATSPVIDSFTLHSNITEKTTDTVNFHVKAHDLISGLNTSGATFTWGYGAPQSSPQPLTWGGMNFTGTISDDWNLTQGTTLNIYATVMDNVGHTRTGMISEYIDPVNDPPEFTMSLSADPYENGFVGITFEGNDPDGEGVGFDIQYNIHGTNSSTWEDAVGDKLVSLDSRHFKLMLDGISHEGALNVRAFVTDSKVRVEIPAQSVTMDTVAPDFFPETEIPTGWETEPILIDMTVRDSGSGLASSWFFVESSTSSRKVDGTHLSIEEEGVWDVSFHARDNSGNIASMDMGTFRFDASSPAIWSQFVDPYPPGIDDDLRFNFRIADNLSGLDLDSIPIYITDGFQNWTLEPERLLIDDNLADIRLTQPFSEVGPGWYKIVLFHSDNAGNSLRTALFTGEIEGESADSTPLDLTIPDEVPVGEDWEVVVNHGGEVTLMARYPNTTRPWMFKPDRKEGDIRTFALPGPYKGPIELWFLYLEENFTYLTGRYPKEGAIMVIVTGFSDTDGDGLEDSWEDRYGYDPLSPDDTSIDKDGDGLTLLMEMYNLTDPGKEDTDGDDMDDLWEARWGTHPFRDDPWEDLDDDGWPNIKEYVGNTDPQDPDDHPKDLPPTPWYWILLIALVLMGICGYFILQMFRKNELEKDLELENDEVPDRSDDALAEKPSGSERVKGRKSPRFQPDEDDETSDWDD